MINLNEFGEPVYNMTEEDKNELQNNIKEKFDRNLFNLEKDRRKIFEIREYYKNVLESLQRELKEKPPHKRKPVENKIQKIYDTLNGMMKYYNMDIEYLIKDIIREYVILKDDNGNWLI